MNSLNIDHCVQIFGNDGDILGLNSKNHLHVWKEKFGQAKHGIFLKPPSQVYIHLDGGLKVENIKSTTS